MQKIKSSKSYRYFVFVVLLLLVMATRIPRLDKIEFDVNESWSIWQTFGTPAEVLRWTPFDWGPLAYLTLRGWREIVGIYPTALRMLSVLLFMVSAALTYRLAARLSGRRNVWAPLLVTAAFLALGASAYIGMLLRGYVFVLMLMPLALLFTIDYFEKPGWWRAIPLAIVMALLFYTHPTVISLFAILGLYSLIFYPRKIWKWWLPGVLSLAAVFPELKTKYHIASVYVQAWKKNAPGPEKIIEIYTDFAGNTGRFWLIIFPIAVLLMFYAVSRKRIAPRLALLLGVWIAVPTLLFLLNPLFGTFGTASVEHLSWILVGISLWTGLAFSALPRRIQLVAAGVFTVVALMVVPDSLFEVYTPYVQVFPPLARSLQAGDVIVIDPHFTVNFPEAWNYYTRAYVPKGLPIVNSPDNHRRVWYLKRDGQQDQATEQTIKKNRSEGEFFGPWDCLFRLYEAPPDATGVLFANGIRFHGIDILNEPQSGFGIFHDGETIRIRLWWSVDRPVGLDYSETVRFLLRGGQIGAQSDGAPQPQNGPSATSQWQPGQLYTEERAITLPYPLATEGTPLSEQYALYLGLYHFSDGKPIAAPGTNENGFLKIKTFWMKSWEIPQ